MLFGKQGIKKNFANISSENFTIVSNGLWVDKTMLIKEFIESESHGVLLTCPRRFGKSLNLSMLKEFFAIKSDNDGKREDSDFEGSIFKDLKIGQAENFQGGAVEVTTFIQTHYQKYPVIFANFKDAKVETYDGVLSKIKSAISRSFENYAYMLSVYQSIENDSTHNTTQKAKAKNEREKFMKLLGTQGFQCQCHRGFRQPTRPITNAMRALGS